MAERERAARPERGPAQQNTWRIEDGTESRASITLPLASASQDDEDELIERLAAQAHESWAGWYGWMAAHWADETPNGEPYRTRWVRQAATPYDQLTEAEKESDRIEARKFLAVMREHGRG